MRDGNLNTMIYSFVKSYSFHCYESSGGSKGPFTQAIFVAATRCNFCRSKIASSFKHVRNPCDIAATNRTENRTWFRRAILKLQLRRDKNCIELPRQKSPV